MSSLVGGESGNVVGTATCSVFILSSEGGVAGPASVVQVVGGGTSLAHGTGVGVRASGARYLGGDHWRCRRSVAVGIARAGDGGGVGARGGVADSEGVTGAGGVASACCWSSQSWRVCPAYPQYEHCTLRIR